MASRLAAKRERERESGEEEGGNGRDQGRERCAEVGREMRLVMIVTSVRVGSPRRERNRAAGGCTPEQRGKGRFRRASVIYPPVRSQSSMQKPG